MKLLLVTAAFLCVSLSSQPNAQTRSAPFSARTHCPMTGAIGTARASNAEAASEAAVQNCVSKGGMELCCRKYVTVQ